jgi:hypothetical protein
MRFHAATETCPECGYDGADTLSTETRPPWHECRKCHTRWGHDCWSCHDAPVAGQRCPVCGRLTAIGRPEAMAPRHRK